MSNTCKTCQAFCAMASDCRRHAPQVFPLPGPGGQIQMVSVWPPTQPHQWCLDYIGPSLVTEV